MKTFEKFLQDAIAKNGEVRLVPRQYTSDSPLTFYAHVNGQDSDTVDFDVLGNTLVPRDLVGVPASPGTPETDADPRNPQPSSGGGESACTSDVDQLVSIARRIQIGTLEEGAAAVGEIISLCAKAAKAA